MITLDEIAYNIKNLAYGGKNSTENNISTNQIKHWIHYHRAKLIADNIDKGITNNQALYQSMSITARNSTNIDIQNYYNEWDVYNRCLRRSLVLIIFTVMNYTISLVNYWKNICIQC